MMEVPPLQLSPSMAADISRLASLTTLAGELPAAPELQVEEGRGTSGYGMDSRPARPSGTPIFQSPFELPAASAAHGNGKPDAAGGWAVGSGNYGSMQQAMESPHTPRMDPRRNTPQMSRGGAGGLAGLSQAAANGGGGSGNALLAANGGIQQPQLPNTGDFAQRQGSIAALLDAVRLTLRMENEEERSENAAEMSETDGGTPSEHGEGGGGGTNGGSGLGGRDADLQNRASGGGSGPMRAESERGGSAAADAGAAGGTYQTRSLRRTHVEAQRKIKALVSEENNAHDTGRDESGLDPGPSGSGWGAWRGASDSLGLNNPSASAIISEENSMARHDDRDTMGAWDSAGGGYSGGAGGGGAASGGNPPQRERKKVGRPITYKGDPNSTHLTEEERRRIKRRIANRESARRVRQKRQELLEELQVKILELQRQNNQLLGHAREMETHKAVLASQMAALKEKWSQATTENLKLQGEISALRKTLEMQHSTRLPAGRSNLGMGNQGLTAFSAPGGLGGLLSGASLQPTLGLTGLDTHISQGLPPLPSRAQPLPIGAFPRALTRNLSNSGSHHQQAHQLMGQQQQQQPRFEGPHATAGFALGGLHGSQEVPTVKPDSELLE